MLRKTSFFLGLSPGVTGIYRGAGLYATGDQIQGFVCDRHMLCRLSYILELEDIFLLNHLSFMFMLSCNTDEQLLARPGNM